MCQVSALPASCLQLISRQLIKSASGVLAARRGSTYYREYAFASSLAAALLEGLSEQPAMVSEQVCEYPGLACLFYSSSLSTPC